MASRGTSRIIGSRKQERPTSHLLSEVGIRQFVHFRNRCNHIFNDFALQRSTDIRRQEIPSRYPQMFNMGADGAINGVHGSSMRKFLIATAFAAALTSVPARADEFFAVTPSGATEMIFAEPPSEVVGKLSAKCIDMGWSIASSTANDVICEAPMNFGQSLMGQLLMGNSYSTPPRRFFKYSVASVNNVSRVQASGWMELQMAFGQMRRTDFAGAPFHNSAMNILGSMGGKPPVGTTFPNHVVLGLQLDPVANGKYTQMRVTSVTDDSAAAKAGVQVGDVINSIAQKRFKDGDDLLDATAKAAKTPVYQIEVMRAGKAVKLDVARVFRAAYTETVTPAVVAPMAVSIVNAASTLSVADEIEKLAKLKDSGLITQTEFDQQKAKLLSR
ncbi:PDZ domain-containing protein [Sphingomonas sanxanigenens]|uniref:PDZ domain-containing protein n=1 Tax=Sphingomonas sanxanigenens TaxID=397260 RepID=UPI0004B4A52E|nr:PDZ domain-containing protein [Sphingomonas sanxanigenens]